MKLNKEQKEHLNLVLNLYEENIYNSCHAIELDNGDVKFDLNDREKKQLDLTIKIREKIKWI